MSDELVILGIAGSLREGSFNRAALRAAQALAPEGATIETFDIKGLPGFSQDDEATPTAQVVELKQRIRAADGRDGRVSCT
jgi:chromate reductase